LLDAVEFRYVGEAGGIEQGLAEADGIPFTAVSTGQVRGRAPWTMARNLLRMNRGAQECAAVIREWRPNAVFMTGGYVAAPVAWAAARAEPRVPLLIYLPDLTPGQAIRVTSRAADRVAVSFPEVVRHFGAKAVVTGYPVRAELFTIEKPQAWAALGLAADLPVLLVFGGSRGARSINRALIAALPDLLPRCQVVHATGNLDWEESRAAVAGLKLTPELAARYHGQAYLSNMTRALVAADLVVARAGAATLGEFPAARLPAILSPYPYAGQHQEANAAYLADRGAALVIPDGELAARLKGTVLDLLDRPERLQAMAEAAAALARPDAADNIADELVRLATGVSKQ
jgi:UDP-N-acetylglucosamine--N-acetylmuramyl-(pentapeptide) pyrophosphoryl-undecaprenol N-acetylglucosamine transferase